MEVSNNDSDMYFNSNQFLEEFSKISNDGGSTASAWAQGLCGVPDVPHSAVTKTEGVRGVGKTVVLSSESELVEDLDEKDNLPVKFRLVIKDVSIEWETVIWQHRLYAMVPLDFMREGSKEGFVALLEYAEEVLKLSHVIICMNKHREDRGLLVKMFMFLGFAPMNPMHPMIPKSQFTEANIFLLYAT